MDVVSRAILDVAFAVESPSTALNVVHPRPSAWSAIVDSIAGALHHAVITADRLSIIPFAEWFDRLEQRATQAGAEDLANIVSFPDFRPLRKPPVSLILAAACHQDPRIFSQDGYG